MPRRHDLAADDGAEGGCCPPDNRLDLDGNFDLFTYISPFNPTGAVWTPGMENVAPPPAARTPTRSRSTSSESFYDWETPCKTNAGKRRAPSGRDRAISHPDLRKQDVTATPLSKAVTAATAERDALLGAAYTKKRDLLVSLGRAFDVSFGEDGPLGFKICLGRVGAGEDSTARARTTRKRILVDETFAACSGFDQLRPHDELIAINGDLIIEIDAEAFARLVERLRALPRPLVLTFAKGAGRERAFALQEAKKVERREREERADEIGRRSMPRAHAHKAKAHEDIDTSSLLCFSPRKPEQTSLYTPPLPPPPPPKETDDAVAPSCGFFCFGSPFVICDCVLPAKVEKGDGGRLL